MVILTPRQNLQGELGQTDAAAKAWKVAAEGHWDMMFSGTDLSVYLLSKGKTDSEKRGFPMPCRSNAAGAHRRGRRKR